MVLTHGYVAFGSFFCRAAESQFKQLAGAECSVGGWGGGGGVDGMGESELGASGHHRAPPLCVETWIFFPCVTRLGSRPLALLLCRVAAAHAEGPGGAPGDPPPSTNPEEA